MTKYEMLYILSAKLTDEAKDAIIAKFESIVTENGGTVEKTDKWGKKRLAYAIQDFNDGLYVLTTFAAEPAAVKELDRVMKITDDILRHMIIRKGE